MNDNISENKEMKTSGLRPPTKIPTMGVSRLPSSSSIKLDGLNSSVTKLDENITSKKLAEMPCDIKHDSFIKKTTDERKSSSSDSFMGDARRLSEAGVRRSSGNSVVLTEDTDKFIIGNRIWVGGTKPGHIAYIGETNFGNGDWAGIVLDDPIGKNDGSVGGTRYFQCESKKGVFARLTNLTSAPLSSVEDSMIQSSFAKTKPLGFSTPMPKRQGSTVTTTKTAVKNIIGQQPLSKSTSDLKIGDRVIISSGQGSKVGVLRYCGSTEFAPGEWCGIELDDPLGKNNGTVEGIKYFECEDKFGLFTPIAKVSKSPMSASRMSTNCAIHKTKRSPGSMNGSMISGVTSNTMSSIPTRPKKLSDLDRLKLQLTQMKNENELLRSQVTKAANQADAAEKKLEETLRIDSSSKIQVSNSIMMLQNQLDSMKKQIIEEKEKVQNLQFTNEEQNVVNLELQNKNTELIIKIKELEFSLDKERNLTKDVEKETMKIFEKEEELCKVKEELESLKKLIDNNEDELQKSVSNLSSEVVDKEALVNALRQTLNENSQMHDRLLKEVNEKLSATTECLNKVIKEKDKKIEQNQEMIEQLNEGIKCLSALKNEEHDDIVNNLKNELYKLKHECNVIIDKKELDFKISLENQIKIENEHKQELKKLLENKNKELEHLQIKYKDLMCSYSSEKDYIEKLKLNLHVTTQDIQDLKANNLIYSKEALNTVFEQQIQSTFTIVDDLRKQFDKSLLVKEKQIETCNTTLKQFKEQLIKSKSYLKTFFNDKIIVKDNEIKSLSDKFNTINSNYQQLDKVYQNVNKELETALNSIKNKTDFIIDLEKKISDLESQQDLSRDEFEKQHSIKLKYIKDELISLKLDKSMLEDMYGNLVKESINTFNVMDNKLKQNKILVENLNKSINELTLSKKNELDSIGKELLQLEKQQNDLIKQHNLELASKHELINTISNKLDQTIMENQAQVLDIQNLNETIKEKNKIIDDNQIKINQLDNLFIHTKNEYEVKIKEKEDEIKELSKIGQEKMQIEKLSLDEKIKVILNEKDKENANLIKKIEDLEIIKISFEKLLEVGESRDKELKQLNEIIQEKMKTIKDYSLKTEQLNDLLLLTKKEFESKLLEKENEVKELSKSSEEKLNAVKNQIEKQMKTMMDEKDKENSSLKEKINILENTKVDLEQQFKSNIIKENVIIELKSLIEQKTKLIEDSNLKIEQLNNMIEFSNEEFNVKLKEKDQKIMEIIKTEKEKLADEKLLLEKNTQLLLDEKDKNNLNLLERIDILENTKSNFEKQLEINKTLENDIIELKKTIEEKTKRVDDDNIKIELLNSLIAQTKKDFDVILEEKQNKINELVKIEEEKLTFEKTTSETRLKNCLAEKDMEIRVLKNQLQEFVENNTENELLFKLESVVNELKKEKIQSSNLEVLKNELEKTVLEHKTELELLKASKNNFKIDKDKTTEEQEQGLNINFMAKIKCESQNIVAEKLLLLKQIDELKLECSELKSKLGKKNLEIEDIKMSQNLKTTDSNCDEFNQLKIIFEKERIAQSHLEFRIQELTDENHRLNERIEGDISLLQKNHDIIQEKYNIEKKFEETFNMLKIKENQILVLQTELNSWRLKDMGKLKDHYTQEKMDKTESHLLAEKNEEIKMLNSIILGLHKKLSAVMETDVSEFEIEKNPNNISKDDYQKLYKTAKNNIKLKECENLSLKQEINKLQSENDRCSEFKTKCESLENDKKTLQKLVIKYESSHMTDTKNEKKSETEKILEEKDWQINLLNNIIAGLHGKVSNNKFRIEALEKQILDSGIDQNKKVRLRTTRLYCERCEVFDSHDTEDCPEKPESPKFQKKRKVVNDNINKTMEEPFCICCDMFGHTANECDSSLTF